MRIGSHAAIVRSDAAQGQGEQPGSFEGEEEPELGYASRPTKGTGAEYTRPSSLSSSHRLVACKHHFDSLIVYFIV